MRDLRELNINRNGHLIGRAPPSEAAIAKFERQFKLQLPPAYVQLLRLSNGGHPEKGTIAVNGDLNNTWSIGLFYHLSDDHEAYDGVWRACMEWRPVIAANIVPFARDEGGNQFLLDFDTLPNRIRLCIHDEDFALVDLAHDFESFIDALAESII